MKSQTKILISEDTAILRDQYCRMIDELGYNYRSSTGFGDIFEEKIIPYQPHLLLVDTKLPGTTGLYICKQLRETDYGKKMGVTGMSNESFDREWLGIGADLFLLKRDITPEILEKGIKIVLEKYRK